MQVRRIEGAHATGVRDPKTLSIWSFFGTPWKPRSTYIYIYMFWATFRCRQNGRQNLPDRPPIGMILDTPTEFSRGAPNRSSGGPVGAPNRSSGGPIGTSGARIWRSYRVCHFSIFIFLRAQGYSRLILQNSAVCQIETRASGMVWGPRSMGCALIFQAYQKVPPARKVPSDPSILIPLGTNRAPGWGRAVVIFAWEKLFKTNLPDDPRD